MKKKSIVVAASLGFAQLALFSTDASAQVSPVHSLDEVVITASRSPKKQSEIGKVVRVINSEQLKRSQGRTLPEILNQVAGLTMSGSGNGFGSNVSVYTRGASAGYTLILIDGVPVNNASGISGEYDISSFAIDQIERVEILRGVNSTLYGSDAVAGVINIITKKPAADKLSANVLATGGTYHTFKEALGVNGSVNKTGIALNFSNTSSKGFSIAKDSSNTGSFDNDKLDQQVFSAKLTQNITDRFNLGANLQLSQNSFGLDYGAFKDDKDYLGKNVFFFGGLNGKFSLPKGILNININQNNVRNGFTNQSRDNDNNSSRQNNEGKITYTEAILNQQLIPHLDLTAGLNYRYTKSDQLYESQSQYGPYNTYLSSDSGNNSIFSGFASLFFKSEAGFNFELGGRYNKHSEYGNNFTYTINPSYVINNRFKFFVNLASGYKVPTIYQLYSLYGNKVLKPEKATSYEGGFDFELITSKLSLSTSLFKRDINDLIYFYTDPVTFASQYRNGNSQKDKGFEVELNANPSKSLSFNAWYAYVEGEGETAAGDKVEYLYRRPKSSFGANAFYQASKAVSFNLIYKYTGSRPDLYYNETAMQSETKDLKAYSLVDVYVQVQPINRLTLFADVKNVFDQEYIEWIGYGTKGRNFNAGIRYVIQ